MKYNYYSNERKTVYESVRVRVWRIAARGVLCQSCPSGVINEMNVRDTIIFDNSDFE